MILEGFFVMGLGRFVQVDQLIFCTTAIIRFLKSKWVKIISDAFSFSIA